ncbi:uncharacterized protein LOC130780499 [Actinidia eriantha]|uniref:uncharacterized protein LOC130780499 n=1 Tax=Actinidia eriantha TaxID=165200 RepID=UPI002586E4D3|nr:uncharacterized protein LOC130780499 [Actinidia eriantha]XP_057495470.1 uncharacterized protein LOC130780499 [Actinidia eriantha]
MTMARQSKRDRTQKNKDEVSGYEQFRDQRIRENMERMQKLGILDLSRKLKSESQPPKRPKRNPCEKKPSVDPPRRSSRLGGMTRVSYADRCTPKKEKVVKFEEIHIKEGSKPEIYTEEDEKLLGDCKTAWVLLVDGYNGDGERIYDTFYGKSCHQCRQKTLGHRTRCSTCNSVQGQFCGDCLYTRYGENILEAHENPNWICPVCRGICNCSRCRRAKGWEPTCSLYRKVTKLGFKSVAHYLIHTRRSQTKQEEEAAKNPVSPSKPPSSDIEADLLLPDEGSDLHTSPHGIPNPRSKDNNDVKEEDSDGEYEEEDNSDDDSNDESEEGGEDD